MIKKSKWLQAVLLFVGSSVCIVLITFLLAMHLNSSNQEDTAPEVEKAQQWKPKEIENFLKDTLIFMPPNQQKWKTFQDIESWDTWYSNFQAYDRELVKDSLDISDSGDEMIRVGDEVFTLNQIVENFEIARIEVYKSLRDDLQVVSIEKQGDYDMVGVRLSSISVKEIEKQLQETKVNLPQNNLDQLQQEYNKGLSQDLSDEQAESIEYYFLFYWTYARIHKEVPKSDQVDRYLTFSHEEAKPALSYNDFSNFLKSTFVLG